MNLTIAQPNEPALVARFDWNMDILQDWDRNGLIDYGSSYGHPNPPSGYRVKLDACSSSRPTDPTTINSPVGPRPMLINSTWRIEGNGVSFIQTSTGCFTTINLQEGSYLVTLTIALTINCFSFCGETDTTSKRISVNDLLIVSIGESYSSGEGNPDKAQTFDAAGQVKEGPKWEDKRCHRSAGAYPAQAALEIERSDPHSSVTFLHFACSGATIEEGLIGWHKGREPPQSNNPVELLKPQTWQVAQAMCGSTSANDPTCLNPRRNIDILTISVGGNDIGFDDIIVECATSVGIMPGCNQVLDTSVTNALSRLPNLYARLAEDISRRFPVSNVLIAEYPDPTHDERGNYCTTFGGLLQGITQSEARWAYERVITRLNQAIKNAAATHGWTYVEGSASQSRTHGYCTGEDQRWYRTMEDSRNIQGPYCCPWDSTGTMHPNIKGYSAIKNLHIPWIRLLTASWNQWSEWWDLSTHRQLNIGVTGDVAVFRSQNSRLEVFVRGQDNHLWHIWQVQPNGDWSGWEDLSIRETSEIQVAGDPAVGRAADGRLEVFTTGNDNDLWLRFQVHSN